MDHPLRVLVTGAAGGVGTRTVEALFHHRARRGPYALRMLTARISRHLSSAPAKRLDEFLWHFTLADAVLGGRFGLAANDVDPASLARFTSAWTALPVKPWRWPSPRHTLWTWNGLLAWTMVNDRPDSPVADASTYSIFVGAPSSQDLMHVDDAGIAWAWDSRNEL